MKEHVKYTGSLNNRFRINVSTHMWTFFNSRYYSPAQSEVGWTPRCRTLNIKSRIEDQLGIIHVGISDCAVPLAPTLFKGQLDFPSKLLFAM